MGKFIKESEILEIAAGSWLQQPFIGEAMAIACDEMGRKILEKLRGQLGRSLTAENWEILLQMLKGKSRIDYFCRLGLIDKMGEFRNENFFFLLDSWESAAQYLCGHYDDTGPEAEEVRKGGPKEQLERIAGKITDLVKLHKSELTESHQAFISIDEFERMDEFFGTVMRLILGKKDFGVFLSEFNNALPTLNRALNELSLGSKKTELSSHKEAPVFFVPRKNDDVN